MGRGKDESCDRTGQKEEMIEEQNEGDAEDVEDNVTEENS